MLPFGPAAEQVHPGGVLPAPGPAPPPNPASGSARRDRGNRGWSVHTGGNGQRDAVTGAPRVMA